MGVWGPRKTTMTQTLSRSSAPRTNKGETCARLSMMRLTGRMQGSMAIFSKMLAQILCLSVRGCEKESSCQPEEHVLMNHHSLRVEWEHQRLPIKSQKTVLIYLDYLISAYERHLCIQSDLSHGHSQCEESSVINGWNQAFYKVVTALLTVVYWLVSVSN